MKTISWMLAGTNNILLLIVKQFINQIVKWKKIGASRFWKYDKITMNILLYFMLKVNFKLSVYVLVIVPIKGHLIVWWEPLELVWVEHLQCLLCLVSFTLLANTLSHGCGYTNSCVTVSHCYLLLFKNTFQQFLILKYFNLFKYNKYIN